MLITGLKTKILFADAAEVGRGYAQVSGYLSLRHILLYLRMLPNEFKITLGRRTAAEHAIPAKQRPVSRLHKKPTLIADIGVLLKQRR